MLTSNRKCYAVYDNSNIISNINQDRPVELKQVYSDMYPNEIIPGLFLGNTFSRHPEIVKNTQTVNIITANDEPCIKSEFIRNMCLNWRDEPGQPLFPDIEKTYEFIDNFLSRGEKVLVHCTAGVSRSASVVIYYLMKKFNLSFEEADQIVRSKRPIIEPNPGFRKQLKHFDLLRRNNSFQTF